MHEAGYPFLVIPLFLIAVEAVKLTEKEIKTAACKFILFKKSTEVEIIVFKLQSF